MEALPTPTALLPQTKLLSLGRGTTWTGTSPHLCPYVGSTSNTWEQVSAVSHGSQAALTIKSPPLNKCFMWLKLILFSFCFKQSKCNRFSQTLLPSPSPRFERKTIKKTCSEGWSGHATLLVDSHVCTVAGLTAEWLQTSSFNPNLPEAEAGGFQFEVSLVYKVSSRTAGAVAQ